MDDDVRFLIRLVVERSELLVTGMSRTEGRGDSLVRAATEVCSQLSADARAQNSAIPQSDAERNVVIRGLLRAVHKLDVLYQLIATYGMDVGRTDLPVGLLHLVDELIEDLLPEGADPLMHLDGRNMYSTLPIFQAVPSVIDPARQSTPHPVAFNLPGLDPGNALFAPILAHEVGHTSWRQGVSLELDKRIDFAAVEAVLLKAQSQGVPADTLAASFQSWTQELMCDSLAATLTGPSFLFAASVFLPAPSEGALGTHPYPRDRIAMTLRILDRNGWIPVLEEHAAGVLGWCRRLSGNPVLVGGPLETALREAMEIVEPVLVEVADATAQGRPTPADFDAAKEELFEHLNLGIPPVNLSSGPASPWLIITAGWLRELSQRGTAAHEELPEIATDARLNRFLLKSIELAGIVKLWGRAHAAP